MGGFLSTRRTGTANYPHLRRVMQISTRRRDRCDGSVYCLARVCQTLPIVLHVWSDGRPEAIHTALRSACGLARHMQLQPGVLDVLALLLQGNSTYQVPSAYCMTHGLS